MLVSKLPFLLPVIIVMLLTFSSGVRAEILIPDGTTPAFFQTSGPNTPLTNGDWYGDATGEHLFFFRIACTPGETYIFQLFDPSLDVAGNPNPPAIVTAPDGTPLSLDEVTGAPDNTTFELLDPLNNSLVTTTYAPGSQDAAWTTLYTLGPIRGRESVDCGIFELRASTADDDENGWRFRLVGGPDVPPAETFDPTVGPDGLVGTGDESWAGLLVTAYQHDPAGCQSFYWFNTYNDPEMYMTNFDMDGNTSVTYIAPNGDIIAGTVSGNTVWNDAPPQQAVFPAFADMLPFDPPNGDFAGDAVTNPAVGLWQGDVCVLALNQYTFEAFQKILFLNPPLLPEVIIEKTTPVTLVNSPGSNTYTITITNIGPGAAMPAFQPAIVGGQDPAHPEVTDVLPAGMIFDWCQVNPPLVGTCNGDPASPIIEIELEAQSATTLAYLAGNTNPGPGAPSNTGTITVGVDIAPGLPSGTTLTNPACVFWSDIYNNLYGFDFAAGVFPLPPSVCDDATVIVQSTPGLTLNMISPAACETSIRYEVINVGNERLDPVTVTHPLVGAVVLDDTALDPGQFTTGRASVNLPQSRLFTTATAEGTTPFAVVVSDTDGITLRTRSCDDDDDDDPPPPPPTPIVCPFGTVTVDPNDPCFSITHLPPAGISPWKQYRLPLLITLAVSIGAGTLVLLRRGLKKP